MGFGLGGNQQGLPAWGLTLLERFQTLSLACLGTLHCITIVGTVCVPRAAHVFRFTTSVLVSNASMRLMNSVWLFSYRLGRCLVDSYLRIAKGSREAGPLESRYHEPTAVFFFFCIWCCLYETLSPPKDEAVSNEIWQNSIQTKISAKILSNLMDLSRLGVAVQTDNSAGSCCTVCPLAPRTVALAPLMQMDPTKVALECFPCRCLTSPPKKARRGRTEPSRALFSPPVTALPRLCRSTLFKLVQQPSDHDSCADQPLCAFFSLKEKEPRRFPDDQGLSCCAPMLSPFLHPTATQPTRLGHFPP